MPEWLNELFEGDRLLTTGFVLFLFWLIGRSVLKSWPFVSKLVTLVNALVGDDDTPGIMARVEAVEAQVATIHHETTPNHGGSLKDAVDRIETRVNEDGVKLGEHLEQTAKYQPMLEILHGELAAPPDESSN